MNLWTVDDAIVFIAAASLAVMTLALFLSVIAIGVLVLRQFQIVCAL
jgi:hypothetical protein